MKEDFSLRRKLLNLEWPCLNQTCFYPVYSCKRGNCNKIPCLLWTGNSQYDNPVERNLGHLVRIYQEKWFVQRKRKRIFKSSEIWNAVSNDEEFPAFRRRILGTSSEFPSLSSVQALNINTQKALVVAPYEIQE